jgi:hypothetical protein
LGILVFCTTGIFAQGKISGYAFGDYFYNISRDPIIDSLGNVAFPGEEDHNGFRFRRIYFTYDHKISETFDSRFRLEADQSANTSNNRIGVAVKDAYLKWKNIFEGSDLILGLQPTPAFEISESVWGYRSLERTILDLRGIVSSRDISISLRGKFDNTGNINYWFMFGNNSGNSPETDKYKRFYGHLFFKPFTDFSLTVYGDLKIRPSLKVNTQTLSNNDISTALFAGYNKKDQYSLGLEGFLSMRENGYSELQTSSAVYQTRKTIGISAFGSYNFTNVTAAVIRFDYFDPNMDSDFEGDSRNFYLIAFVYKPIEVVSIMPNVLVETYEEVNGTSFDSSVTGRITFYYIFL